MIQKFGEFRALEVEDNFFVECDFFSMTQNESFPIFLKVQADGSIMVHDNGFLTSDYASFQDASQGIGLVANAFGFDYDGKVVSKIGKTLQEKTDLFSKLISICYSLESTFLMQGGAQ